MLRNSKPTKAQRAAQSARDKSVAKARASKPRNPQKSLSKSSSLAGDGRLSAAPSRFAAVSRTKVIRTNRPQIMGMRNGDCRIVHREYIQDITAGVGAPSAFKVDSIPINPGQSQTFPWLSSVARNFESYKFRKLRFCYETEAPSSLGGTLILAVDYDASDAQPATKLVAMAYRNSVRSAPWEPCCHSSMDEDLNKLKSNYIRTGSQPANTDIKLYDIGNLFVCSQNVTTTIAVCGELYVEYDVDLITPSYELVVGSGTLQGGAITIVAAPFGAAPVATGPIILSAVNSVITIAGVTIGQEISVTSAIVGTVITGLSTGTLVGLTAKTVGGANAINAAATNAIQFDTFLVTAAPAKFTLTVTATTVTASEMVVATLEPKPAF
jgi:hypothetical protein